MLWNWGTTIYIWLFDVVWGFKRQNATPQMWWKAQVWVSWPHIPPRVAQGRRTISCRAGQGDAMLASRDSKKTEMLVPYFICMLFSIFSMHQRLLALG